MKIINTNEFKELNKDGYLLVDFFANWCGPCKMLTASLESADEKFDDVNIVKIDVDNDKELAMEFGVMSIPAVFLFKDGEQIGKFVGYKSADELINFINDHRK